jgi:hypothetical protein
MLEWLPPAETDSSCFPPALEVPRRAWRKWLTSMARPEMLST